MVMLVVAFVSFSLFTFVGDPVHNMVGEETSDQERGEIREALGLNDPIPVQFIRFVKNASKGNFGISYQLRRPVSELISERLPATLELVFISALIALIIAKTNSVKNIVFKNLLKFTKMNLSAIYQNIVKNLLLRLRKQVTKVKKFSILISSIDHNDILVQ